MASSINLKKKPTLLRKYGYFECKQCNKSWQSAHVYCDPETLKAKYKQMCKECKTFYEPYKTDDIKCSQCGLVRAECKCKRSQPDDPKRAHRNDLCQKCLSGDPCTSSSYHTTDHYTDEDDHEDYYFNDNDRDDYDDSNYDPYNFDDFLESVADEYNYYEENEYNYYDDANDYNDDYYNDNYNDYESDDEDN